MKFNSAAVRFTAALFLTGIMVGVTEAQNRSADLTQMPANTENQSIDLLQKEVTIYPLKPPNTSSPRATLQSFLENVNGAYRLLMAAHRENMSSPGLFTSESVRQMGRRAELLLERGAYCLNLTQVPDALKFSVGTEGTLKLKEILDRIELPPIDSLPDAKAIEYELEHKKVPTMVRWPLLWTDIVIARVKDGPRQGQFLFTPETVARLDDFLEEVWHLPYREDALVTPGFLDFYDRMPGGLLPPKWSRWLPEWSTKKVLLYQTVWQWCALIVLPLLAIIIIWTLSRWWRRKAPTFSPVKRSWEFVLFTFMIAAVTVAVSNILIQHINIHGPLQLQINAVLSVLIWIFVAYGTLLVGIAAGKTINASKTFDSKGINAGLINATTSFFGFVVAILVLFYGLSGLGISIIPILTGLGVGGLAVALAARPTLENLIGGFMILLDRPYRVGQRIKVKDYDGEVERIGFRSTRLRLLTGFQAIIPNEEMARLDIENVGRRPYIRRHANITITYNTPPDKIEKAVEIIHDLLKNHEGMSEELPPKVFFNELNADSLNIEVYYWYHHYDLWEFRALNHKFNLALMRAFEKEGIEFAFPTTTNYLTQEDGQPLNIKITDDTLKASRREDS